MPDNDPRAKAVELLFVMNAAITNIRLYPPTSAIIVNSVERMCGVLNDALSIAETLEYAESEKSLLVQGESLPEKEQRKPQISAFLEMMLDLGIKTISIDSGITKDEISAFIQIVGRTPGEIQQVGGLQKLIKQFQITHMRVDEKIYVEMDSEHKILAGMNLSDEDFVRILLGEDSVSEETVEQIRENLRDPNWFSHLFQAGVRRVLDETENWKKADLSQAFVDMIDTIDGITDFDKSDIAKQIVYSMDEMTEDLLVSLLTQNLDKVFGDDSFRQFVEELAPEKFARLFDRIRRMVENPDLEKYDEQQIEAIKQVYELLKSMEAGKEILRATQEAGEKQDGARIDSADRIRKLKAGLNRIIQGDTEPFSDPMVTADLPEAVKQLLSKGKDDAVSGLISKMGDALLNDDPKVRQAVAAILLEFDGEFEQMDLLEKRIELSQKLVDYIRLETTITPEYEKITDHLQSLSKTLIENDRSEDAEKILDAYHLIHSGNLKKDEAIAALAGNMLQNLATDAILDILLKDQTAGGAIKDDIYSLVILGTTTIERLLDRLRDSHNMSERNRIVQVITRMGKPAIRPIVERLDQGGPWYYVRNLALLLGRIGDESHLRMLEPLLESGDHRIQREAIKSIQAIGGEGAGRILLDHLGEVNNQLKSYIVTALGAMQTKDAAPYLVGMLEDKYAVRNKAERDDLKEKVCEALGRLKSRQAIPALEKIVRAKGLLSSIRGNPEKVRSAAAKALANIKRG